MYASAAACSKPMDKVFSLLALIDSREADMILKDPGAPTEQIFASATVASIVVQSSFAILELIRFNTPLIGSLFNLPSWVVDFTVPQNPAARHIHAQDFDGVRWTESKADDPKFSIDDCFQSPSLSIVHLDQVDSLMAIRVAGFGTVQPTSGLGNRLAQFLQTITRSRAGKVSVIPGLSFPASFARFKMNAGVLNVYGPDEAYYNVVKCFFATWNMMTGFSGQHYSYMLPVTDDELWPGRLQAEFIAQAASTVSNSAPEIIAFVEYTTFVSDGCVIFVSEAGLIGLAPASIAEGDSIVLVPGSKLPMIFRQAGDGHQFRGFAFVHGIWDGELIQAWKDIDVDSQTIILT